MLPMIFRAPDATGDVTGVSGDEIFIQASGDSLQLPAGFDPAGADYSRAGPDLMMVGPDGTQVVVADFFMTDAPPTLVGAEGAHISGALAARLAGPMAPGQVAGEMPDLGEPIGRVNSLTGEVTVVRADGTRVTLKTGDDMFLGDILETGADAGVGVLLADGTSLSMGDDARMVLDEMVYDPGAQTGHASVSVLKGVFTIVSGEISKTDPEAMTINTPVATIGIRGTQVGLDISNGHDLSVVLMEEADGFVGEVIVINDAGAMTLNQAYFAVDVGSFSAPPAPAPTYSQEMILNTFGVTLAFLPTDGTNANDYGLQAELAAGMEDFETDAGGEDELGEEGLADFEEVAEEAPAEEVEPEEEVVEAVPPEELIVAAGEVEPVDGVVFGEEAAPLEMADTIAAAAVGETEIAPPPPPPPAPEPEAAAPPPEPVVAPNVAPVADPGTVMTAEDNVFTGQLSASDLEGGELAFAVAPDGDPDSGTLNIEPDGAFTYVPEQDFGGTDNFTYQVTDDAGQRPPQPWTSPLRRWPTCRKLLRPT